MTELTGTGRCSSCGEATLATSRFCSHCGRPLEGSTLPVASKPKWYYNVWFTLLMLFFVLGPFGLPLVWKNPHFSRTVKGWLTVAMIVYTVVLVDLTIRTTRAVMNEMRQFQSTLGF